MKTIIAIIILILFKRYGDRQAEADDLPITKRKATTVNWITTIFLISICGLKAVTIISTIIESDTYILFNTLELITTTGIIIASALSFRYRTECIKKNEYDSAIQMNDHIWWLGGLVTA